MEDVVINDVVGGAWSTFATYFSYHIPNFFGGSSWVELRYIFRPGGSLVLADYSSGFGFSDFVLFDVSWGGSVSEF